MSLPTDIRVVATQLYFLPIRARVPLKFGPETVTEVTCARAKVTVVDRSGRRAEGWGETPLSVQWVWPSKLPYENRLAALKSFCLQIAKALSGFDAAGHPMELGHDFQEKVMPTLLTEFNRERCDEAVPWLAALVCCSLFDLAAHDAFGRLAGRPIYETYSSDFVTRHLGEFLEPAKDSAFSFTGRFPDEFLLKRPSTCLRAWHLVGGVDPLDASELRGDEPKDGYPVLLEEWIRRDGLKCLKVKLRGNDAAWDLARLIKVGALAVTHGAEWLTADFNCTVDAPNYVNEMLDRLRDEHPRLYGMLLYVEQPFPYELEQHRIDVHAVSSRKPLFLDESAHDWRLVRLGRQLGWNGVALKTCKTQTGAILSACWAKAHGMALMVQDLSNPMLAQIPHVLLASHVGTIMGVETNGMQFYPEASTPEAAIHSGLFRRREGMVDLSTVTGSGFGYRLEEIHRKLPQAAGQFGG